VPLSVAERLLLGLGVTVPQDIDLEVVAHARRARVAYRPLQGAEAHIQGYGDQAVITINLPSTPERRRYSLAHELGHWHLHRGQRLFCRGDEASVWRLGKTDPERAADAYAADLLMPSYLFVPMAERAAAAEISTVRQLKELFGTSLTATAIRLVERGPFPALVAWYDNLGELGWQRSNHHLPLGLRLQPRLHHDTAAFELLYAGRTLGSSLETRADAWLLGSRLGMFRVTESSALVNEGVLVLLWFRDARLLGAVA
jgi:Zn-dependent peptidase ImmA (M78 family)